MADVRISDIRVTNQIAGADQIARLIALRERHDSIAEPHGRRLVEFNPDGRIRLILPRYDAPTCTTEKTK
jgi:hypothetical protein